MHDKYQVMAAKYYHLLYHTNFYKTSTDHQRQWTNAMKDLFNEVGFERDPRTGISAKE